MKNNTMAFCGTGETAGKAAGKTHTVFLKGYVAARSGRIVSAKSPMKPQAKSVVSHFNPTTSKLQRLADVCDAAFEEYKLTGKLPGRSRIV